jgi:hypothetical protein
MKARLLLGSLLLVVCLATLWGVCCQRGQLAGLRAEQQQLVAQLAARAETPASRVAAAFSGNGAATPPTNLAVTPELLRLRSEVTRLTERRRELASARAENERLRAELAGRGTNAGAGRWLSTGFVRRSEARMVGYNSPEDTLQSLLWAVRNQDMTNALQAFAPAMADELRSEFTEHGRSMSDYFTGFIGVRVTEQSTIVKDGSRWVQVELVPGMAGQNLHFIQTNGQWKIEYWP